MADTYIEMKAYYSKSKSFLYPILNFSRTKELFRPETYLFFHHHSILDGELTVFYHNDGGVLYKNFEMQRLADHPLLVGCYTVPEGTVYIFDIAAHSEDIQHFLCGQYSKFSKGLKKTILRYFGDDIEPMQPMPNRHAHAVLFPDEYRKFVAKDLEVSVKSLTELAPIYDLEKETLNIEHFDHCNTTIESTTPI